ncbi:MAG TPA: V-type ATP synthase subunit F [Verrucomicrobiae bacterium]
MKFHCIADEDTVRGFGLAGVSGEAVDNATAASAAIAAAAARPDCGVIILTSGIADAVRTLVDSIRFERERPLILEIPGPSEPAPGRQGLRELVQAAVGIRLETERTTNGNGDGK